MSDSLINWPSVLSLPTPWQAVESKGFTISRVVMNPADVKTFETTFADNFGLSAEHPLLNLFGSNVISTESHPAGSVSMHVEPVGLPVSPVELKWVPGKDLELPKGVLSDMEVLPELRVDAGVLLHGTTLADAWAMIEARDLGVSHLTMSHSNHMKLREHMPDMLDIIDSETSTLWGAKVSSRGIWDKVLCLYGQDGKDRIVATVLVRSS